MYDVIFYSDSKGNEPVAKYINGLRQKSHTNKTARITGLSSYITSSKKHKRPLRERLTRQNGILQISSKGMINNGYELE